MSTAADINQWKLTTIKPIQAESVVCATIEMNTNDEVRTSTKVYTSVELRAHAERDSNRQAPNGSGAICVRA